MIRNAQKRQNRSCLHRETRMCVDRVVPFCTAWWQRWDPGFPVFLFRHGTWDTWKHDGTSSQVSGYLNNCILRAPLRTSGHTSHGASWVAIHTQGLGGFKESYVEWRSTVASSCWSRLQAGQAAETPSCGCHAEAWCWVLRDVAAPVCGGLCVTHPTSSLFPSTTVIFVSLVYFRVNKTSLNSQRITQRRRSQVHELSLCVCQHRQEEKRRKRRTKGEANTGSRKKHAKRINISCHINMCDQTQNSPNIHCEETSRALLATYLSPGSFTEGTSRSLRPPLPDYRTPTKRIRSLEILGTRKSAPSASSLLDTRCHQTQFFTPASTRKNATTCLATDRAAP